MKADRIMMAHGSGGTMMRDLIEDVFMTGFGDDILARMDDAASLNGGFFDPMGANDTNRNDIFVFGNDEHMMLISRLDNLGKGASGAAAQNMNIMLGLDEGAALAA